ncbi:FTR1 family protein [Synechocystis sp. LKSZ1]|uniref:FTR1 family iron permease n=1 Tax=Synechocystis sp. LKSZ1 TaxID=3144951 RepID=UPI00336BBE25
MNFSAALPTFIITLREGVEAALVVGIVLAYLKKARQTRANRWVYGGIGVGILASALIGVFFNWLILRLPEANQKYTPVIEPLLEGSFSLLAIVMLSWMLVWMTRHARQMRQQVEGKLGVVFKGNLGEEWGIFTLVFLAVVREGFESVLFIAAKFQQGLFPALGAIAGIAASAGIGILLFKWGVKLNIKLFFQVMGIFLLFIVAGLVITALGHFDVALHTLASMNRSSESLCFFYERFAKPLDQNCMLGPMVWNFSQILPEDQFPGIIFNALLGYSQRLYFVQAIAYGFFIITVGGLYFHSLSGGLGILYPFLPKLGQENKAKAMEKIIIREITKFPP